MAKHTNRITVTTHSLYWQVTVTPSHGRAVTGFFPNRNGGVVGTPAWFIRGVRELRDLSRFPFIDKSIGALAELVETAGISITRSGRTPWADIELVLAEIAITARTGKSNLWNDTACTVIDCPSCL
jgi:hypothetical protein